MWAWGVFLVEQQHGAKFSVSKLWLGSIWGFFSFFSLRDYPTLVAEENVVGEGWGGGGGVVLQVSQFRRSVASWPWHATYVTDSGVYFQVSTDQAEREGNVCSWQLTYLLVSTLVLYFKSICVLNTSWPPAPGPESKRFVSNVLCPSNLKCLPMLSTGPGYRHLQWPAWRSCPLAHCLAQQAPPLPWDPLPGHQYFRQVFSIHKGKDNTFLTASFNTYYLWKIAYLYGSFSLV